MTIRSNRSATVFLLAIFSLIVLAFVASPLFPGFRVTFPLETSQITAVQRLAFAAPLPIKAPLSTYRADTNEYPQRSELQLFEDGHPLEPAHAVHAEIGSKGGGRYSHWSSDLIFSSSDGSDPRVNGRYYEVTVPIYLSDKALSILAIILAGTAVGSGWLSRRSIIATLYMAAAPWKQPSRCPAGAPAYRADIDGLRAISVISVVLVHYGAPGIPGGFTGVDIFFVISGYLITSILWSELSRGEFSIVGFYARRFRRILPALLVVLTATLAAGSVLLTPDMYAKVARSAIAAGFGFGNFFFYANTGYFDAAGKEQPLLHTWSLGVEEQFYLVWPLLLGAVAVYSRHSRAAVLAALAALIGISFAASIHDLSVDAKWAFYSPFSRAWELGLGASIVFIPAARLPGKITANILSALGVGLIAFSFMKIDGATSFPGPNALFACVGAALLILPQREPTLVARVLALPPMRLVGLISYSLYLWHWPILVLAIHYNNGQPLSAIETASLIAASFGLSWVTWRFVETPFRRKGKLAPLRTVGFGLAAAGALCCFSLAVIASGGFPSRLPEESRRFTDLEEMWRWPCPAEVTLDGQAYCTFGAPWSTARHRAIIYGDSKAEHLAPLLSGVAAESGVSVLLLRGCPPQDGGTVYRHRVDISGYKNFCEQMRQKLLSLTVNQNVRYLLLTASWASLSGLRVIGSSNAATNGEMVRTGIEEIMPDLAEAKIQVWLLGDTPNLLVDPASCSVGTHGWFWRRHCLREGIPTDQFTADTYQYDEALKQVALNWPNTEFLSLGRTMCRPGGRCLTWLDDEPLYRDKVHFRRNLKPETVDRLARLLRLHEIFEEGRNAKRN